MAFAAPAPTLPSVNPVVQDLVSNVSFHGVRSMGIESFLNIKFGQDTSGNNRFAAPKRFEYESGSIINAAFPGAACPQQKVPVSGFSVFSNVTSVSEDCLTVRVDRPANTTANSKLPVLLWIYGGGDTIGQIYDKAYDPTGLVLGSVGRGSPIVYAAMNYRLGFFGFSAFEGHSSDAVPNAGLLDQRLGMEWVKKHIASFGGDPDNVTIFGESDGATAVGLHITAFGGKQSAPFRRAIMESGSATADAGVAGNLTWTNTQKLTRLLNCSNANNNASESVACLRNFSLEKLFPVEKDFTFAFDSFGGFDTFIPAVDDNLIPLPPSQLLMRGNFSKNISTIIGWNQDDGSIFTPSPDLFANSSYLRSWVMSTFSGLNESTIESILSLYPANSSTLGAKKSAYPSLPVDWIRASQITRDTNDVCPALLTAQALSMYNTASTDVSTYLYTLNASLFTPYFAANNLSYEGITHFSDIPFVFNQALAFNASNEEVDLASQFSGSWIQFAYNGRPSSQSGNVNSSLSDWPVAIDRKSEGTVAIKIIGGMGQDVVSAGPSLEPEEDFEEIGRRCAFWNRPEVLEGLGV